MHPHVNTHTHTHTLTHARTHIHTHRHRTHTHSLTHSLTPPAYIGDAPSAALDRGDTHLWGAGGESGRRGSQSRAPNTRTRECAVPGLCNASYQRHTCAGAGGHGQRRGPWRERWERGEQCAGRRGCQSGSFSQARVTITPCIVLLPHGL